jgi:hypothetical protein
MFEQTKTVHALDRAATLFGNVNNCGIVNIHNQHQQQFSVGWECW